MSRSYPNISPLIEHQFPDFYREEGEMFVAFVKAYYEWLEQPGNVTQVNRSLLDYRDIDTTLEEFIVHFKEKYLKNIQFTTASNKRLFVKNSLDFYRSKGSERAVDLFFKLIFGIPAEVYTPGTDIMKLSSGTWVQPVYLEVTKRSKNVLFVGRQIRGLNTGSSAFVERLVRKKIKGKYIDIFYISNMSGDFQTGEILTYEDDSSVDNNPVVIGSLNDIYVVSGGAEFEVGEEVALISNTGSHAKATVNSISNATGQVSFNLVDGGYGYTANAEVLVSNVVIIISNIIITNPAVTSFQYFRFKTLYQPLANIVFSGVTGSAFEAGSVIESYYANGDVAGNANILTSTFDEGANTGEAFICFTGDVSTNTTFHLAGNGSSATLDTFEDKQASANSSFVDPNVLLHAGSIVGQFIPGETIIQFLTPTLINAGGVVANVSSSGPTADINIVEGQGLFFSGYPMLGLSSGATSTLNSYGTRIGMVSYNGSFTSLPGNYGYEPISNTYATVDYVSLGAGAGFSIGGLNTIEYVNLNDDYLVTYANVALNAVAYGFPADAGANASQPVLADVLTYTNTQIGSIASIVGVNPGNNYTYPPYVTIYEPKTVPYAGTGKSMIIHVTPSKGFSIGEVVTGSATGARNVVMSTNGTVMTVKTASLLKTLMTGETITGAFSGATANVVAISPDSNSALVGINANVTSSVQTSNGSVQTLRISDSGIGYANGEAVSFYSSANTVKTGYGITSINKQGSARGFYVDNGGFLSDGKYLHDGEYYQEYSYEILTALPFELYSDMLKKVLHVAGTKAFGKYVSGNFTKSVITPNGSEIEIE